MKTAVSKSIREIYYNPYAQELVNQINTGWKFNPFLLYKLPLAFIAGVRVKHIETHQCSITIPYRWISQNPFRSTYFAALSMAAEMSTGLLAMAAIHKHDPKISVLVVNINGDFSKKATGVTTFTCTEGSKIYETVGKAIISGEGETVTVNTIGTNKAGKEVARFTVTWSFKVKQK